MIVDCTALILAGGDSSRMGQDKATLTLAGRTLLDRAIGTMQAIFPEVMVSVRQPRAGVSLPQVCDEQEEGGPLAGLVAGLAQTETPWLFALACDMPFVPEAVVEYLATRRKGHQAVVPLAGGYPQPLAAFYARSGLGVLRAALAADDRSLRGALAKLDVCYVGEEELRGHDPQSRSFFDLDTPQDFRAAAE